ncbi:uncharacterized protein TRIADDRAFT_61186 [Trichoplax adhaerens]|uniref:Transmembrane protein n=1 Tax=Trichoplax adhaerens TaxID=10228 RepID=B3SA98_TRIAD|nr:hypothetical protein TRIADDRAFT_61186 [Trichoplax adhaerens]EDV20479.1 hypothetical protein TRIADDRAFT_61186 [Trichoplax adhaerens]|eukprot:XP_002117173.1 hypothetical protein TRIADDRAFT_61186 [Trichoplax adhaerens]
MTKQVKVDIDLECPKEAEQSEQPDKSSSSSAKTWVWTKFLDINISLLLPIWSYDWQIAKIHVEVIAVVAAMTGVFVFAYSYGLHGSSILGIIFSLSVAVLTAIYRVYLKLVLPDPSVGQASLLLTVVCALIVLFSWPLILVAISLGIETIEWETIPWYELNVTSIFSLLVSALIFLGTAVSFPIFVAVGMLLSIPGNAFVDVIYRHIIFDGIKIFGVFLICSSFLILLIPVDKARRLSRWMVPCCYRKVTL